MASWDRLSAKALAKQRDEALRRQVRDAIGPFSPYWRDRFAALGISASDVGTAADLVNLPAVGERDVCPDGDPARMSELVLQVSEGGYVRHAPGTTLRRALARRLRSTDDYRRIVDADVRPTSFVFSGLGLRYPLASTRSDLDLVTRAGARLWHVLGLTADDVLVSAAGPIAQTEHVGLAYAALGAGAPALFPGTEPARVAETLRLTPATVLAASSAEAADVLDDLAAGGADLSALRTLLLVGAPARQERRAAEAALAACGAPGDAVALAVHAPNGARVLWGQCREAAVRELPGGFHTYPDLEVVETVDPDTGDPARDGEPAELVLTQLGYRGSALLRWRTGDVIDSPLARDACPACGRTVPRVPDDLRGGALVRRQGSASQAIDLRSVAAALAGRADISGWRLEVGRRVRDGQERLLAHVLPNGDPGDVAVGAAEDVLAAAGVLPEQFVVAEDGTLPAIDGDRLSARIVLRR
jgi:phenylacetate-coenzyme A ligase PaaK-like adenylate-forming protein